MPYDLRAQIIARQTVQHLSTNQVYTISKTCIFKLHYETLSFVASANLEKMRAWGEMEMEYSLRFLFSLNAYFAFLSQNKL